jgi:hypothetical protein
MTSTSGRGWGWMLLRATLIGTVLQLGLAVSGHYDARIANLFAVGGMFLSLVAGLIFSRWSAGARQAIVIAGAAVAGAVCALVGILESYFLKDVPAWVIAFGPASSAVTGAIGGFLGRIGRRG